MTNVEEMLADVGHARKAIENLAGMKLCDVIVAEQEIHAIRNTIAKSLLKDVARVNCLDLKKLDEISYIETLFLLYDIHKAGDDRRMAYGGDYGTGERFNSAECYLWHVYYLAGYILKCAKDNLWLRIVLATPIVTYYKALCDISGEVLDPDLRIDFAEMWNSYKKPYEMCTMTPKEKGEATVEDVLRLFYSIVLKNWTPSTRSIRAYEYEVRHSYCDIGQLLIEMPVHAYKFRMKLSDVLQKYEAGPVEPEGFLNGFPEDLEELPFN